MATTPVLDDNHTSDSNHLAAPDAVNLSTSPTSNTPTTPPQPPTLSQPNLPQSLQATNTVDSADNLVTAASTTTVTSILQAGPDASVPSESCVIDTKTNHNESNIKLKRCKHGRIKIKDLSKKKLGQGDIETNNARNSSNESNNNHITTNDQSLNHNSETRTMTRDGSPSTNRDLSNHWSSRDPLNKNDRLSELSNSDQVTCRSTAAPKSSLGKNNHKEDEKGLTSTNKDARSVHRSRSRSRTTTPPRSGDKWRNPARRSRYSDSSSSRDRSLSRDRSRSDKRRHRSPSPVSNSNQLRRRKGSRKSSKKRRKRGQQSPDLHRHRTPERHDYTDSYRHYRRYSYSRSPVRRTARSRTRSPIRRESSYEHRRRDPSLSPPVDRTISDKYPNSKGDSFKKLSPRQSPKGKTVQDSDKLPKDSKVDGIAVSKNSKGAETRSTPYASSKPPSSTSQQRISQPIPGPNFLPKLAQADPDPRDTLSAHSPTTPSNRGSAASDVYDPEGPVLPISPVESPPIVEKPAEDDLPSSAVQLNQQEKYLQKFHRQERVVEEVKIALRPFYQDRSITKEQYKDVLRKAVPKICHSKNGEINPVKIQSLVEAYIRKMR